MFRGLKLLTLIITTFVLTNCGVVNDNLRTTTLVNDLGSSDSCNASSLSQQFIIQHKNGKIENYLADSKQSLLKQLTSSQKESIQFIENDFRVTASTNAQSVSASNNIINWGLRAAKANSAWQKNITGKNVTVAVIDSAIHYRHAQLEKQMLYNNNEIAGNGVDDDGNGLVDDYLGYDFLNNKGHDSSTNQPASSVGDSDHGTHIAGIIAAQHSSKTISTTSIQGIAPGAKILPVKFLDNSGSGNISQAVRAINYAVSRGAKIINASWGGSHCSKAFKQAIGNLESKNVIFVAATGNSGKDLDVTPDFPSYFNIDPIISVGALGTDSRQAVYSNYGNHVSILAPGTSIVSAASFGTQTLTGTSMAAPFVSGAIALMLQAKPLASLEQIKSALQSSDSLNVESALNSL